MKPTPTLENANRRAWERALLPNTPPAYLKGWLLEVPGAHPFWKFWMVSMIALREMPGVPPAIKDSPDMTHEFSIYTINPEVCPDPDPAANVHFFPFLHPADVLVQVRLPSDGQALALLRVGVTWAVDGLLSPDSDFRSVWQQRIREEAQRMQRAS